MERARRWQDHAAELFKEKTPVRSKKLGIAIRFVT